MNNWEQVRKQAQAFYTEVCVKNDWKPETLVSAADLIAGAGKVTGIKSRPCSKGHPLLAGALARIEGNKIIYDKSVEPWLALYFQAHEYGHLQLKHGGRVCTTTDIDSEATEEKLPLGVHRVEGYGPQERIECEANVFAREFLLPCPELRKCFGEASWDAEKIAEQVGLSIEIVCHQLARALLIPETTVVAEEGLTGEPTLDDSQRDAAQIEEGPVLISAGPGTGKTRALAGRVLYLLGQKVNPASILILTFSNKAAEELRSRVRMVAPEAAQKIRIETFHSFGLELLRKYGTKIGLPAKPFILDPVDALFLLEAALPQLQLDHYENLYEPTRYLNDILKAISRAKDENVGPTYYEECATKALAEATTQDEIVAAEKALEVARVYSFYQQHLQKEGVLDFGDLLCRSIEILQNHPSVKIEIQQTYLYVLVDEYQDVNRASGLLLKEVVGAGERLWAVGDIRQSIHRWRGATTANIQLFAEDFPGAKPPLSLEVNYRSQSPIIDVFSALVPQMSATKGSPFTLWQSDRGHQNSSVKYEIAEDLQAEAQGIAREIKQHYAAHIPYRVQAVICRSHTSLARIARYLEKEKIPILYLGDFFERAEIRDMLSLLSFTCQADGRGLIRVARFPEYNIALSDVQTLRKLAREQSKPFPEALKLAQEGEEISQYGKEKFLLLQQHLENLCHGKSAWQTLTRYLFVRSRYLTFLPSSDGNVEQPSRLAIYQLLQFVHSHLGREKEDGDPKRALLRYIRRLEIYGEERQLRQVPAWADGIDAVRLLTIHASKGLEFQSVFLPYLGGRYMPTSKQPQHCPPPAGVIPTHSTNWHQEEEECLFFVALSRARDHLCLSRASKYGKANSNASKFISYIANYLPKRSPKQITWPSVGTFTTVEPAFLRSAASSNNAVFLERHLDLYLKCPRKYFYEVELGLSGRRDDSAYIKFHQCVYDVLRWLQAERQADNTVMTEEALMYLSEVWQKKGPVNHIYEAIYQERAKAMVEAAIRRLPMPNAKSTQAEHEISLSQGSIRFTFDYAELVEGGGPLLIQRMRTGKPTKSEAEKRIYGLYRKAAEQHYPQSEPQVQTLYLTTNETRTVVLETEQIEKHLTEYENALQGIQLRQFPASPNDERECPQCPHYFICPVAEDEPLA